jgi:hypothetical protein
MISATKKILANIKSPTLREVLKENIGISRYDKYSNNSHRTNELDPDGLESFCEFSSLFCRRKRHNILWYKK